MRVQRSVQIPALGPFRRRLWSGMRDCMVILCLTLEEPSNCFPQPLRHFTYPSAMQEGFSFFASLLTFSSWPCQWVWCVNSKMNQLYIYMRVCSVDELRLTLCDPRGCSLPGSSVLGILQARILKRVAIPFSRRSSRPRDWTYLLHLLHWRVDFLLLSNQGSIHISHFEYIMDQWNKNVLRNFCSTW